VEGRVDKFEIQQIGPFWALTFGEVILSRSETSAGAIMAAVQAAARYAAAGKPSKVVLQPAHDKERILWDSTKDGFVSDACETLARAQSEPSLSSDAS
jgi:hypothetical protein